MSRILVAAFGYVDRCGAWPLFPADAKTKRPLIKTGTDHAVHASIDLDTIRDWHRRGLLNAIGMPTGAASGTVVIDADVKHDGEARLAELEADLGPLPQTKMTRTQSGGRHVYCAHPGNGIRVRNGAGPKSALGKLLGGRAGVDVRADGGIVILPPSCGYVWITDDGEPLPALPPLWLAAIQGAAEPPRVPRPVRAPRPGTPRWCSPERVGSIPEGSRNERLYDRGVALRVAGATDAEILDDLEHVNDLHCSPPVSTRELAKIAASAARATGRAS